MKSDDALTFVGITVLIMVILVAVGALGGVINEETNCNLLAEQLNALDSSIYDGSCVLQFENGVWITQAKYIEQLISEEETLK